MSKLAEMFVWLANLMSDAILLETIATCNADRKSERSHAISAYDLCGKDILLPDELIRVPRIIGSRTAFVGNDMSLGSSYDTTVYQ